MTLQQGWAALASRDLDSAKQAFMQANQHESHRAEALRGLARIAILQGDLDSAERMINQSMSLEQSPHAILVRALIMGEQGQRANAYKQMLAIKLLMPHDGFLLAAMGEQRIRQGYWDEGTALFIESLKHDHNGLAFAHVREVICDMSEAIAAGKLPPTDPVKMLNRIDANSSNKTSAFFAAARRHISQGQVVPRRLETTEARTYSAPAPQPSTTRAPQMPSASQPRMPQQIPAASSQAYSQEPLRPAPPAARSEFLDSLSEERALNAKLQDTIDALPSFNWPSQQDAPIDDIPLIKSSMRAVADRLADAQHNAFRVSQGNIFVQLYMERCFEGFTRTIPTELTGGMVLDPALFTFLDLNLLDGTLSTDFEVMTSDLTEIPMADHAVTAFAYFLGESLTRTFGGAWSYHERADQAEIHIDVQTIKPYELCKRWLDDPRRDPGVIYQLVEQLEANKQNDEHTGSLRHEYIDPTAGTVDQELASKLAGLWSFYCIRHARMPVPEITRELKVIEDFGPIVLFEISSKLSPKPPGTHSAVHPRTKRLAYAYRRRTGEFLMLGRPSCLAHVLGETHGALTSDNAGEIVRFIATYHAPGAMLVESDEIAQRQFSHLDVTGPKLMRRGPDHVILSVWLVEGKQARELTLSCQTHEGRVYWRHG